MSLSGGSTRIAETIANGLVLCGSAIASDEWETNFR